MFRSAIHARIVHANNLHHLFVFFSFFFFIFFVKPLAQKYEHNLEPLSLFHTRASPSLSYSLLSLSLSFCSPSPLPLVSFKSPQEKCHSPVFKKYILTYDCFQDRLIYTYASKFSYSISLSLLSVQRVQSERNINDALPTRTFVTFNENACYEYA